MSFIGRQVDVGIGKESVRGTAVAPSFWLPAINKTIEDTFELATDEASRGVIEADEDAKVVKRMSEGDIEGLVRDKSFGLILLNLFGSVVTSDNPDTDPAVKDHAFSVLQSVQHPSLSIALKHPAEDVRFSLAMISDLSLDIALGEFVRYTASFMGKKSAGASNSVAYTVENEFVPQHVTVKFANDLAGLDASPAVKVKSANLSFAKNVETDDVIGSIDPNDILNKEFRLTGSLELMYDDTTFKALAVAGTQKAVRIEMTNTDVTIGASANPALRFDLAKVKITEFARNGGNADLIQQGLTLTAYYSSADAKMVTAKLTNTQASY